MKKNILLASMAFVLTGILFADSGVSAFQNMVISSGGSSAIPSLDQVTSVGASTSNPTNFSGGITVNSCNGCGTGLYSGSGFVATTTATIDYGAIGLNSCDDNSFTATGTIPGDVVNLGVPGALVTSFNGFIFEGYVNATDTVSIRRCNVRQTTSANPSPANIEFEIRRI